jgi:hypothetical protein
MTYLNNIMHWALGNKIYVNINMSPGYQIIYNNSRNNNLRKCPLLFHPVKQLTN